MLFGTSMGDASDFPRDSIAEQVSQGVGKWDYLIPGGSSCSNRT